MALIAGQINPANYPQPNYSGVVQSAQMQAREMANIGASIGGVIKDFGEAREQRKKIDAETKASRAGIESAIKLGDALGFDVKGMLSPVLDRMDDPNTTPMEAAALGREASTQIANVLNLGFKAQDQESQRASLMQDAAYKNEQLKIAQQNANSRAQTAIAAGRNAPPIVEMPLGDGSTLQMQWNGEIQSYTPIPVSGLSGASKFGLGNLPDALKPFAKDFETAGAKYGVAPNILAAISMHETGNGTSSAFRNKNNAMGISDASGPIEVGSVAESIDKMARLLGKGINEGTGPYANVKSIEDIANIYAPPGAGNDPRNLNQFWTQGVTSNIQKLSENKAEQVEPTTQNQGGIGFTPAKLEEGKIMSQDEIIKLIQQGFKVSGTPAENGSVFVTDIQSLAPQMGKEVVFNKNGTITMRDTPVASGLNKSPTTNLKEGEALVEDANSPTGTKIVQIPSEAKEKAQNDFTAYISQVGDSYARLDKMGKAVSAGEANPLNYAFSTPIGQTMARMFGEEGQTLRDDINTMAPNIINVIRQSTQMGSKGMDSDAEREFYIKAMGDPRLPIEANIKALDALDKAYGKGNAIESIVKNYPDLAKKVNAYKLNPPKVNAGTTGSSIPRSEEIEEIRKKYLTPNAQ